MVGPDYTGTRFEGAFEYADHTVLHPAAGAAVLLAGIAMLSVPRRYAAAIALFVACFVPSLQRIAVLSLDFDLLRLLLIFAWLRVALRGEYSGLHLNRPDRLVLAYCATSTVAYVLLWRAPWAFWYKLGESYDFIGYYFFFRCVVRGRRDMIKLLEATAALALITLAAFLVEFRTGRNFFSVFGGVPQFTVIREGKLRCQGAFSHSIMAGCFWVGFVPLFLRVLARTPGKRALGILAAIAASTIVLLTHSSTPYLGFFVSLLALMAFPLHRRMTAVRWACVMGLVALDLVMKAPVWHLIARVDLVGGSTGYHRYALLDAAIRRFREWWLVGTRGTAHWGWGLEDVTNHYVLIGVRGGALSLALFAWFLAECFRQLGRGIRRAACSPSLQKMRWAVGAALFTHCVLFLGVSYFGQAVVGVYLVFAIAAALPTGKLPSRTSLLG